MSSVEEFPIASAPSRTEPLHAKRLTCPISGRECGRKELVRMDELRPALAERIRIDHPNLADDTPVSRAAVNRYRNLFVEELLRAEHGEFSELDRRVADSIASHGTIAENTEQEFEEHRSLGDRVADAMSAFGGSWAFLISFALVLVVWTAANAIVGAGAFDPYPFILLNLILSCLAAVQAPIIMMSQRRQEAKDRLRALNDYEVNLKAELEIRHLHEKLDHLITKQWQRLAEIQQMQLELLQEGRRQR